MSTALLLQFFMVQAVNYSVIIVKIKCKKPTISNRKRVPWCELINPYNFSSLSMCFTIRHGKRLPETLIFTSVSEAATSRLGLVSDKILNVSVSSRFRRHGSRVASRSRLRRSRAHPWLL